MERHYNEEKNIQILLSLLKEYGIKKMFASPGATNINLVASMQSDPYFEMYSCVDERSACYMACGMAAETGEPVMLSCTGATASRNYIPGLTEAFYRKLPVIAITSTQKTNRIGHLVPQVIDRNTPLNDIVKISVKAGLVNNEDEEWGCRIAITKALLECRRNGGGPVHINLETNYSKDFSTNQLPNVVPIKRYCYDDILPEIPEGTKVAIFIGAHKKMSQKLTDAIDRFCGNYDAVAFSEHTSGYKGRYEMQFVLVGSQSEYISPETKFDLLIHLGEQSSYSESGLSFKQVWRVSPDGEVRDLFRKLTAVFEMSEQYFFEKYAGESNEMKTSYYDRCSKEYDKLYEILKSKEIPFSNLWTASVLHDKIPADSSLHFGILNTIRVWNFFKIPKTVMAYCNVGGFGIDGNVSTLIGSSLANKNKLFFGIVGDLAFFYDMNVVGNREVGNNVRIMLVNNGLGTEFRNYNHPWAAFGDDADAYGAAAGHNGAQSPVLVKNFAENLGYEYMCASTKEEFYAVYERFITPEITDKPMLFEVFTKHQNESDALRMAYNLITDPNMKIKRGIKKLLDQ